MITAENRKPHTSSQRRILNRVLRFWVIMRMSPGQENRRSQLRRALLDGKMSAFDDAALLEALLHYAQPGKDTRPLAMALLGRFGGLAGVFSATPTELISMSGVKESTAALITAVNAAHRWMLLHPGPPNIPSVIYRVAEPAHGGGERHQFVRQEGTGLVSKALLQEAMEILPEVPPDATVPQIRAFLTDHLTHNSAGTRKRYTGYIFGYLFPGGEDDPELRAFARAQAGTQGLADVLFYRFCRAYPFEVEVMHDVVVPSIGRGGFSRAELLHYVVDRFPDLAGRGNAIRDGIRGIIEAMVGAEIVRRDGTGFQVRYRPVPLASFAYVLGNEFPEPGIHPTDDLLKNPRVRALLWDPDALLPSLYELRNRGLIAKIASIDTVRQFTTTMTKDEMVAAAAALPGRAVA